MEQPKRAVIEVMWLEREPERIPVQYNPTELTLSKDAQIAEINIPGLDAPLQQFVRGGSETLTLDLFFDSTEDGMGADATSVTTYSDRIYELVKIEPGRHAPPVCRFLWGTHFPGSDVSKAIGNQKRNAFTCLVTSVRQRFTLFSSEGVPLRATLTVTLREYKTLEEQLEQLNLKSPDRTQNHVVRRGDTLASIAARYYRRPGEWRPIAEANGIDDPRRLAAGTFVQVPPIQ